MQRLKHIFLMKLVFLVVVFSFFTTGKNLVHGDKTDAPVLARVEVEGMLDDLGLPVYAHLLDAAGEDYALVIAPEEQLERANVQYRVLDKNAGKGEYFILSMFAPGKRVQTDQLKHVLLDDGKQVLVRSTFEKIEAFNSAGFEVLRLDDRPMVLKAVPAPAHIAAAEAITYDTSVAQMIGMVTQADVDTYLNGLSGETAVTVGGSSYTIVSRYTNSGTPLEKATQYVYEFMDNLGLTASYHNWSLSGYTGRNVVGELTGTTLPNEIVVIGAHLDCMPSGSISYGADDNGSGSIGVMLMAEILSQYAFDRTVRFVFFTGEEQGLLGSNEYSDDVYQAGDNIVAVYNMDMMAYDAAGGPVMRLHTRYSSSPGYADDLAIANTFVDVVNTYGLDSVLSPVINSDNESRSDHKSFWDNGYPGILTIEDHMNDMTPYYHTTSDRVSTVNMVYLTNIIKASVGTAAHLAGPDDGTIIAGFSASPTSGGQPLTVNFTDESVGATSWSWDFGDTGASTDRNPTHVYNSIGNFTVTLTVSNASGSDVETKTNYITVTAPQPPVAGFTASSTNLYVGQTVDFTDTTTNSPTSWSWTFAGGTPSASTAQNPTVTYNTVGTYTVSLTATNLVGSDTLTRTGYITVSEAPLVYCDSQGTNYSYEYIGNVTVADLDNSSSGSSYTDYTHLIANLTAGNSAAVSLTPVFPSTTYTEFWKIWIDYNIDGDFDDAGEEVFSSSGTTTVTGSFTVPADADGLTRMRVSMKWNAAQTPCETFSYGEVEDYTVNITGITPPDPPVADFSADVTTVDEGGTVNFTDLSTNTPTSWSWSFPGGTPSTGTAQNPSVVYNTAGTYDVTLTATNAGGSDGETKTAYITVNVVVPDPPVADFSASATTVTEGGNVTFTDLSTNNPTSWSWSFPGGTPSTGTARNPSVVYNTAGTYDVTLTSTNAGGSDGETKTGYITVNEPSTGLVFESGTVSSVGSSWQSVTLANTYTSPVVVCSTELADSSSLPVVVRVRNAAGNSFDVMVQNPSGTALSGHTVHYVVVEEGVYTSAADGVTMEAVKATSSVTAVNGSWALEPRSYTNSYSSPVVVGQVMTYNDASWSVFWACGASRTAPPSASAFNAGKEVGEDTDATRADETIGYIVIETGSGTMNGIAYTAGLGADSVKGPDDTSTGYTYNFTSVGTASAAIVSVAAMDGGNGGWPVLYGSNPFTASSITTVFDEDQIKDTERKHTTEQVAYIVFGQ